MNQLSNYTGNKFLPVEENYQNEYISLYGDVIVYRNITPTFVYKFIESVPESYMYKLLLVRQNCFDLSLLWHGTVPKKYQMYRHPVQIKVGDITYNIVASMTTGQDKRGYNLLPNGL